MGTIAETLGAFVAHTSAADLPTLAFERAKMSLASTLASAAAGVDIDSARMVRDIECSLGGEPTSSIWFSKTRLPADRAARVNAVASDAAASDDSDKIGRAHV